ncbi:MAG TPA: helix-turn-helix domain-containing protein [Polyangiaceae bacterium]|nr:helix-turn-helix domain-containing protein [Polyangiaceae bacterium]
MNDGRQRRELADLVRWIVDADGDVAVVLIEAESAARPGGDALQALVHWTALLGREPYIARTPEVVQCMILARQSNAEKELIASASIEGDKLVVWTCEPRRLEVPVASVPSLVRMKPQALSRPQVSESGSRIHWEDGDVDLTAESIRAFADPDVRREQQTRRRAEAARYVGAIRQLREKHGLRQADVKGLSERQVRRLEEGHTMPRAATLEKLAQAHGLEVDAYLAALAALSRRTSKSVRRSKAAKASSDKSAGGRARAVRARVAKAS